MPEPELEPEPELAPEHEHKPETETDSDSDLQLKSQPESEPEPEPEPMSTPEPHTVYLDDFYSDSSDDFSEHGDNSFILPVPEETSAQTCNKLTRDIHGMDVFSSEMNAQADIGVKDQIPAKQDSPEPIDHEKLRREEIVAKLSRGISMTDRRKRIDDLRKELDEAKANLKPSKDLDISRWSLF